MCARFSWASEWPPKPFGPSPSGWDGLWVQAAAARPGWRPCSTPTPPCGRCSSRCTGYVPLMKGGADHPYFRPGELPVEWRTWQSEVFSGRHITKRTDRDNVGRNPAGARKLLVKDVFACGLIAANVAAHPDVAPALVMRHPIAVALSKQAHSDWLWTWSPEAFFTQSSWVEDHLGPHVDALTRVAREEGCCRSWWRCGRCFSTWRCGRPRPQSCPFCTTNRRCWILGRRFKNCQPTRRGRAW